MKTGIELIAAERQEQIMKHHRSTKYDVNYNTDAQLRIGAVRLQQDRNDAEPPDGWDTALWEKIIAKPLKERLIIAGALIAAEIDRLQYLEEHK
jgi:hypothetical protein